MDNVNIEQAIDEELMKLNLDPSENYSESEDDIFTVLDGNVSGYFILFCYSVLKTLTYLLLILNLVDCITTHFIMKTLFDNLKLYLIYIVFNLYWYKKNHGLKQTSLTSRPNVTSNMVIYFTFVTLRRYNL